MSYTWRVCVRTLVVHLSYTCRTLVVHLSFTHVVCLPCNCRILVVHSPSTCHTLVVHLSYSVRALALYFLCIRYSHARRRYDNCITSLRELRNNFTTRVRHVADTCCMTCVRQLYARGRHVDDKCTTSFCQIDCNCRTRVVHMSCTCRTLVVHASYTCRTLVVHLAYTCRTRTVPLSCQSPTNRMFISQINNSNNFEVSVLCFCMFLGNIK